MTDKLDLDDDGGELVTETPRQRAERLAATGLLPPPPKDLPPLRNPPLCHGCAEPLHPFLVDTGETLHPNCDPPRRQPTRRRR